MDIVRLVISKFKQKSQTVQYYDTPMTGEQTNCLHIFPLMTLDFPGNR